MKNLILASLSVLSFSVLADKPSTAMSSEVYDMLTSKAYWENEVRDDPVPQIDLCFEAGREKSKSGKSLLRYVDSCMEKKGYMKRQLAQNH